MEATKTKAVKSSKIRRGRDVSTVVERSGGRVRNGKGSHIVAYLEDGTMLPPYYAGELSPGVRAKVLKALAAAGLVGSFIGALAFWFV